MFGIRQGTRDRRGFWIVPRDGAKMLDLSNALGLGKVAGETRGMSDVRKGGPAARLMEIRLRHVVAKIESRDFDGARGALRGWDREVDFSDVPAPVRQEAERLVGDAMSFMKGQPPDSDLAIGRIRKVLDLWR